jgi:monoamine oxidase
MLGAAAFAPSLLTGCSDEEPAPPGVTAGGDGRRVVIVGAGLAGLACADRLVRAGIHPVVLEANLERIGGRCWSSRGWADGQVGEHGGEFIDTRHARIRALAKRFGLRLEDRAKAPLRGSSRLWLDGARRRFEPLQEERDRAIERMTSDAKRVGYYGYRNPSRAAREMDATSVADWLDENVPGGARSRVGRLISVEMAGEFGLDAADLSALNLLYEYVENPVGADERFHIEGGNDQLVAGLAAGLPDGTVRMDAPLEALAARGGGGYALQVGGAGEMTADQVVLCLPFTKLREVDLEGSRLSRRKRRCIDELGMGTNAKVIFQTSRRPSAYGWNGYMLDDRPNFITWESSLGQPGADGLITTYLGGRSGGRGLLTDEPHGPASAALTKRTLADVERADVEPIATDLIGEAWADHWSADPFTHGAYAAYLPGQYTRFYGYAGIPEDGIHFAGEHTATDYQGYLEGAVETGERAAREVHAARSGRR